MCDLDQKNHKKLSLWKVNEPVDLPPYLDSTISRWIHHYPEKIQYLLDMHGSPLNIVWPHTVPKNLAAIVKVTEKFGIKVQFYYAVKVTKSQGLLRAAILAGTGTDVSSLNELNDAIKAGCKGNNICATGPAKTREFIEKLIAIGARIVIDSLPELNDIIEIAKYMTGEVTQVRVLVRYRPDSSKGSRFGMPSEEIMHAIQTVSDCDLLKLEGFHFHLSGYAPEPRIKAFFDVLPFIESAFALGLDPRVIDIGGGLPIQYIKHDVYQTWFLSQKTNDYRTQQIPNSFYPYGGEIDASQWLTQFLSGRDSNNNIVHQVIKNKQLTICVEPGRSLVDQGAVSIFRVCRVRKYTDSSFVIFVEGSSFSACETWFDSEFLIDPLHVSRQELHQSSSHPVKAWIAGHSCLDEDVITNRLISFKNLPQVDDLLIFSNTAAYQMDLLENQFHRHKLPTRIKALVDSNQKINFTIDI